MIKNEEKKKIQNCVDKYNSIKQYVKMFKNGDTQDENNNNNNDIYDKLIVPLDSIKQNIDKYNTEHNFITFTNKINTHNKKNQEMMEEFIYVYKRLKILKILNISLKACEKNNKSINTLNDKTQELKKIVTHEIDLLQKDILTSQISNKNVLLLNDLLKEIEQYIIDVHKLKKKSNDLFTYYEQSKNYFYFKNKKDNFDIQKNNQ